MPTIFSKIVKGEIPCHKLIEDENYFSFLDIRPIRMGHALVIPKREIDVYFDLEDDELAGLMIFAKKVAKGIKSVVDCNRIGVAVLGLEVPHVHVHLVPIDGAFDIDFSRAKEASQEDLSEMAQKINAALT